MTKRVNNLEKLGEVIRGRAPAKVSYGLGKEGKRSELLITYIDGRNSYSARIASSPFIQLRRDQGRTLMNITGSNNGTLRDIDDSDGTLKEITDSHGEVRNAFGGLRPTGAGFEMPYRPSDEAGYELGDLAINLEGGRQLGISQYLRAA